MVNMYPQNGVQDFLKLYKRTARKGLCAFYIGEQKIEKPLGVTCARSP
jgi:hypothetical protein